MHLSRRTLALMLGLGLVVIVPDPHAQATAKRTPTTRRPTASTSPTTSPARGKITVGDASETVGLDPATVTTRIDVYSVSNAIYDTLMDAPSGKDPSPELLSSMTESADRRAWALTVRDGITFHDGTPLTADAVKVNLDRQRKSPLNGGTMALIRSIDVTGPKTLTLTLDKAYGSLPYFLSGTAGIMLSPKSIAEKADRLNRQPTDAGTGPYVLKEWVPGDHTTVARNPSYWGATKPRLDQITFRVVPDEAARYAALRAGDLQIDATTLPDIVTRARVDGYTVVDQPIAGFGTVLLNTTKPPFDDVRVRRAMVVGRDLRAVAALFGDPNVDRANDSLWPVGDPWYSAAGDALDYDRGAARALVSTYVKDTGKDVSFTLLVGGAGGTTTDATRLLVRFWQDAGMDAKVQSLPDSNALIGAVVSGQFQAAGWVVVLDRDPDSTAYGVLHSTSPRNWGRYKSVEMDALLDAGRVASDVAARKTIYAEVQRLFRKEVPFLVGTPGTRHFILDSKVCGVGTTGGFTAKTVGYGNC